MALLGAGVEAVRLWLLDYQITKWSHQNGVPVGAALPATYKEPIGSNGIFKVPAFGDSA